MERTHLRAVREAQGLSLRETARLSNIDVAHLSRAERGKQALSLKALIRLLHVLGLNDLARQIALCAPASTTETTSDATAA